jgi:hypothetical protein
MRRRSYRSDRLPRHGRRGRRIWLGAVVVALALVAAPAAVAQPMAQASPSSPAGATKSVAYRGVRLSVPASWPVYDLQRDPTRCVLFNASAVYLGNQGPEARCPASAVGVSVAVQLVPGTGSGPPGTDPAAASASDNQTQHRISATSADGSVTAVISYDVHDQAVAGLLHDLGVSQAPRRAPAAASAPRASSPVRGAPAPAATAAAAAPHAAAHLAAPLASHVGLGFDTCGAPSVGAMATWVGSSPYRTAGIYLGGANRACPDGNLSAGWITTVAQQGWNFIPIYVGLQAPCVNQSGLAPIDAASAAAEGQAAADDAVSQATRFGLGLGTPIYFDSEAYNNQTPGCTQTVLGFLSGWTSELHAQNFLSGIYGSSSSTIFDLAHAVGSSGFAPPDDIWLANWNGKQSVYGDPFVSDGVWVPHQRLHQYAGGHDEAYGGVTINIDSDYIDGATASAGNGPPTSLQVFAKTSTGRIVSSWQFAPSKPFGDWRDMFLPAQAAGSPEIGLNQNGALQAFVRTTDGRLLTTWQAGASHPFGTWLDMGLDGQIASDPTAALNTNGTTQILVAGTNGRVLTSWQVGANQPFGGWLDLGMPARAAGGPVVATGANGALQVFVHTTDNRLLTSWQSLPSQPFGGWLDLGLGGQIGSDPSVGFNSNGTMQVFVTGINGRLVTSWQVAPNQAFGGWLDLGLPASASGMPEVAMNQ